LTVKRVREFLERPVEDEAAWARGFGDGGRMMDLGAWRRGRDVVPRPSEELRVLGRAARVRELQRRGF
jgi:hypothetical protein